MRLSASVCVGDKPGDTGELAEGGASILEFCNKETDALKKYAIDLGRRYRKFSEKNGSEVRSVTKGTGPSVNPGIY